MRSDGMLCSRVSGLLFHVCAPSAFFWEAMSHRRIANLGLKCACHTIRIWLTILHCYQTTGGSNGFCIGTLVGAHGLDARNIPATAWLKVDAAWKVLPCWKMVAVDHDLCCSMLPSFLNVCSIHVYRHLFHIFPCACNRLPNEHTGSTIDQWPYTPHTVGQIECEKLWQHPIPKVCVHSDHLIFPCACNRLPNEHTGPTIDQWPYTPHTVGQIECEKLWQHPIPEVCVHSDHLPWRQALQTDRSLWE